MGRRSAADLRIFRVSSVSLVLTPGLTSGHAYSLRAHQPLQEQDEQALGAGSRVYHHVARAATLGATSLCGLRCGAAALASACAACELSEPPLTSSTAQPAMDREAFLKMASYPLVRQSDMGEETRMEAIDICSSGALA